jgi:hypothetical protein
MLGSSRAITTSSGTVCYNADFYPYGGEQALINTCPQNYKFEGKERDGGWPTLPRGTGVNPCTIEIRGVPNLFCGFCRKGSDFDVALPSIHRSRTRAMS